MKRSRLGPGKKSIERGSTFDSRGHALERTTPLRAVPAPKGPVNPHLADLNRRLAFLFHDSVQGPFCPVCHERCDYLHAHHCVDASFLDRELRDVVTPERLIGIRWDLRNGLGACEVCHGGHHGPSLWSRITRRHIPASAFEFAKELDAFVGDERFTVRLEAYVNEDKEVA